MYTTTYHTASVSVEDYLRDYVDIPSFLKCCRACHNYENVWACPPFDFNVEDYWKKYQTLQLLAVKIAFNPKTLEQPYTKEEVQEISASVLAKEKTLLTEKLFAMEAEHPGSVSLSAGSCNKCKNGCAKKEEKPCRFPDTLRYSIEALGGNVGLTLSKLMGFELEWMTEGKLPPHFVLVGGLLLNETF